MDGSAVTESFLPTSLLTPLTSLLSERNNGEEMYVQPYSCSREAACLLADISGYTAMSRALCSMGADGVDALRGELNGFFGKLVDIITDHGGDIYKFAGDAIIVFWSQTDQYENATLGDLSTAAIRCAMELVSIEYRITALDTLQTYTAHRGSQAEFEQIRSSLEKNTNSDLALGLHCGIGAGQMEFAILGGGTRNWEFMANGPPLHQIEAAVSASTRGQVAVSAQVWEHVQGTCKGSLLADDPTVYLIEEVEGERQTGAARFRSKVFQEMPAPLRQHLPAFQPPVTVPTKAGDDEDIQAILTGQIREISVLFVNIVHNSGGNVSTSDVPLMNLQPVFYDMQRVLARFEAMLRQFLVDDKGIVLIAVLGTPKHAHPDDADRALRVGLALYACLKGGGFGGSIGIASGTAYCGRVGNNERQEYAVIGSVVNLAAKIMAKNSQGGVRCEEVTMSRADKSLFSFEECEPMKVKGFDQPVSVYEPREKKWTILRKMFLQPFSEQYEANCASRRDELSKVEAIFAKKSGGVAAMKFMMKSIVASKNKSTFVESQSNQSAISQIESPVILVHGRTGMGKSVFVKQACRLANQYRMDIFACSTSAGTKGVPFATFRQFIVKLLEVDLENPMPLEQQLSRFLESIRSSDQGEDLAEVLLALLTASAVGSSGDLDLNAIGFFEAIVDICLEDKTHFPSSILIVIEDIHWIDDASWQTFKVLASGVSAKKLTFMVSSRTSDLIDIAEFKLCVELLPFTVDDTTAILNNHRGTGCYDLKLPQLIFEISAGNPFWTVELAKASRNIESIDLNDGNGKALSHFIIERYDKLSLSEQRILQVASVIGVNFSFAMLLKLLPTRLVTQLVKDDLLTRQEMQEFITPPEDMEYSDEFCFTHSVTHSTVYELMPRAERIKTHQRVAMCINLEYFDNLTPYYFMMAEHYSRAELHDRHFQYLVKAIGVTIKLGTSSDLIRLGTQAMESAQSASEVQNLISVLKAGQSEVQTTRDISAMSEGSMKNLYKRPLMQKRTQSMHTIDMIKASKSEQLAILIQKAEKLTDDKSFERKSNDVRSGQPPSNRTDERSGVCSLM